MKVTRSTRRLALAVLGSGVALAAGLTIYRMTMPSEPYPVRPAALDEVVTVRLQVLYDELLERKDVHQAVVVIETGDGTQRWVGSAREPGAGAGGNGGTLGADTPVVLASITKLYTAALVLRLAERGRLGLDQPITSLLPDSLIHGLHRLDGVDQTSAITIRHLLAHTSGLADYFTDRPRGGQSLSEQLAEADMDWTPSEMIDRVRTELTPHFPPQPARAEKPKIRYSDTNYLLLRLIVEETEGGSLIEVMQRELLEPLGLPRTTAYPIIEPAPLWIGADRWELPLALGSFGADGAMVAPLGEAIAFMRALVRGQIFDNPATYDLMQAQWNRFGLPLDPVALQLPNWPIEYGLGVMRFRLPTLLNGFQRMPAVLGHTGSTGSWLFYCPELDLFLAGTVNQATAGALPYRFVPKLLREITR